MTPDEAITLVGDAIRTSDRAWIDLGAGDGVFTVALTRALGPFGRVVAVDHDPLVVQRLGAIAAASPGGIEVVSADLTDLPPLGSFDGALLANVLHFVPQAEQGKELRRVATELLASDGRIVVVEYERRAASRWVPYPVPLQELERLARDAGLTAPVLLGVRESRYGGRLYAAWMMTASR